MEQFHEFRTSYESFLNKRKEGIEACDMAFILQDNSTLGVSENLEWEEM